MPPKKSQPKKKKAVGPQRGFATTSTPKKVVEPDQAAAAAADEADAPDAPNGTGDGAGAAVMTDQAYGGVNGAGGVKAEAGVAGDGEGWDEAGNEKHLLQTLADKIRPGSDKEIARIAKAGCACSVDSDFGLVAN